MTVRVWVYMLNMAKFECPHCSQKIDVPDDLAGADAGCPACGEAINVPVSGSEKQLPALSEEEQRNLIQQEQLAALLGNTEQDRADAMRYAELSRQVNEDWQRTQSRTDEILMEIFKESDERELANESPTQ